MKLLEKKSAGIRTITALLTVAGALVFTSCSDSEGTPPEKTETTETNKMKGFNTNIEKSTLENKNFRKVLYTSKHNQLVLMSLKPKEDIGEETHPKTDQFFRFEGGHGKCIINGTTHEVKDGDAIVIPAGAKHNIINTDATEELKMYTIYSPPHHKDGIVMKTKKEAKASTEEFDGVTSEK